VLGLCATACDPASPYALKANGTTLSRSDFESELKDITANPDAASAVKDILGIDATNGAFGQPADASTAPTTTVPTGTPTSAGPSTTGAKVLSTSADFVRGWLTLRIQAAIIHQEFVRRKLTVDADARSTLETQINQAFSQDSSGAPTANRFQALPTKTQNLLLDFVSERTALTPTVTTADAQAAYDKNPAQYARTCISQIEVADQATAAAVKAQLDGGADFATVATAKSTDSVSAQQGGVLTGPTGQCWTTDEINTRLPPEFGQAVLKAQPNVITGPVQSSVGWHVILVKPISSFADVQTDVTNELQTAATNAIATTIAGLEKKANISVSSRYGRWDPTQSVVVPLDTVVDNSPTTVADPTLQPAG
jgi:parvulin-like peptidyl-prolyl isomerase